MDWGLWAGFIVAALIGQESSYVADVISPANAWGLMQILPSTGRQLARAEGVLSDQVHV